jgi:mutator protein MutT
MDDTKTRKNIALGILRNSKGRVLIIKRTYSEVAQHNQELTWAFPGGKVENGGAKAEVKKEFKEETGYEVEVGDKISERDYEKPHVHLEYYICTQIKPTSSIIENTEEVDRIKWVEPAHLENFFTTDVDPKVAEYLGI